MKLLVISPQSRYLFSQLHFFPMNSFPSHCKSLDPDHGNLILSINGASSLSLAPSQDTKSDEGGRGRIKLIQLLLTCANHASTGNLQRADACLQQISKVSSITGNPMQRLAARFSSALAVRLIYKRWPGLFKALQFNYTVSTSFDFDQARSLFRLRLPYMDFTYAVINRTLLQGMSGEQIIHIVDLGSGDPNLWIPFIRGLAGVVAQGNKQNPCLRITCVRSNMVLLGRLGVDLSKEARNLNMPLQFNPLCIGLRKLTLEMLKVTPQETLVEQESDHNKIRLMDRFAEGLHFYSALFDSISASFEGSRGSEDRLAIEEMFGKEIENIVACEGLEREERHEPFDKWRIRFAEAGFRPVRLWCDSMEDAERLVGDYGLADCKISGHHSGCLMICWHDRPIYTVSAWNRLSV